MKKVLVLGGNGFLGRNIVNRLATENNIIVADHNLTNPIIHPNVTYKEIDFINCKDFSEYLNGIDLVIHLISTINPNDNLSNINSEIEKNIFPTTILLESMVKNNVSEILFLSSGGTVYGEHGKTKIKENADLNPICNYAILKILIEKYLHLYYEYYAINYKIVRLANPYSDVIKENQKQGIIPIIIDRILNYETIDIWGDGEDIRDYIYIEDAMDAIEKIINYHGSEKVFNVGTGIGYSLNELIEIIKKATGINEVSVNHCPARKCDVENNVLDISKITALTGWQPKVNLNEGIKLVLSKKMAMKEKKDE